MPARRSQAELAGEFIVGTLDDDATVDFERCFNADAGLRILTEEWTTRIDGFVGTLVSTVIGDRSAAGRPWVEITQGIEGKTLHYDHQVGSMTYLVRMQPDARCPVGAGGSPEDCLVIAGDLILDTLTLKSGDRHHAPASIIHSGGHSETGAVLIVRARDA